jgi:hypothetical protein
MVLHEDGTHVDIFFLNKSSHLSLDISSLSLLTPEELQDFIQNSRPDATDKFVPMVFENYKMRKVMLIPTTHIDIPNKTLMNNVCSGHYIDFRK